MEGRSEKSIMKSYFKIKVTLLFIVIQSTKTFAQIFEAKIDSLIQIEFNEEYGLSGVQNKL